MTNDKKRTNILEKIFVPVVISILTAGTAPWWTNFILSTTNKVPEKTTLSDIVVDYTVDTRNNSQWVGNNRWDWTVYLEADSTTMSRISCVVYTLHPSFPDRFRKVCNSASNNFALTSNGWGNFDIDIKVTFKDGNIRYLVHRLVLR